MFELSSGGSSDFNELSATGASVPKERSEEEVDIAEGLDVPAEFVVVEEDAEADEWESFEEAASEDETCGCCEDAASEDDSCGCCEEATSEDDACGC